MTQHLNLALPDESKDNVDYSARSILIVLVILYFIGSCVTFYICSFLGNEKSKLEYDFNNNNSTISKMSTALTIAKKMKAPETNRDKTNSADAKQIELDKAQKKLAALQRDILQIGEGASDRLSLVARTIPSSMWISDLKTDNSRFEVSGIALNTADINSWISSLSSSPVLKGLKLKAVEIDAIADETGKTPVPPVSSAPAVAPANRQPQLVNSNVMPTPLPSKPPIPMPMPVQVQASLKEAKMPETVAIKQPTWSFKLISLPDLSAIGVGK